MNVRHVTTALALPCALVCAERAAGQDRSIFGPEDTVRSRIVPAASAETRLPFVAAEPRRASITSLQSWSVGPEAEVSLGRFRIVDQARRRTNMERERAPLQMDMETKAIAGAGLRVRF
jgi:hypothetical protein